MSTGIPFGAHHSGGAPPTTVVQASSYFGAPSGNSPTDANPFHFVATGAPPPTFAQPQPGPPSASNFFAHSNPNVNIFNPAAAGGTETQHQQTFAGDSFGVSATAIPPQAPQSVGGPLTAATQAPLQTSDFLNSVDATTHSESASILPQGFPAREQAVTDEANQYFAHSQSNYMYQRHSSAPSIPGGLLNQRSQPGPSSGELFSPSTAHQPNSLPSSNSQEFHSHPLSPPPRPYSQEPPSPQQHQPQAVGYSGSLSAPSTTLHQVLPGPSDHQQHQQQLPASGHSSLQSQQVFSQTGCQESSSSPISPSSQPPSNADVHDVLQQPGGGQMCCSSNYPLTNADCADSNRPLSMTQPGMLPNQVHPSQVHPSLTEELGVTNASHGSLANIHTNASTDVDFTSISAAIEDATTPDDDAPAKLSHHELQRGESSGRDSPPLDSKSLSSLLDGSQDDFSRFSPIRLLPPAPLEGDQVPQTHSDSQQFTHSGSVSHLPVASLGSQESGSRGLSLEQLQFSTEHGHTKNPSDDLKDWEIVDSVPLVSEVSQLPSSIRLLPPSSFTSVPSETIQPLNVGGDTDVSQAMQQLSLAEASQPTNSVQLPPPVHSHAPSSNNPIAAMAGPPPPPVYGQAPSSNTHITAMAGPPPPPAHPAPLPATGRQMNMNEISPVTHFETNFTNLEKPPPSSRSQEYRPSHSESHLHSTLPEPTEISSLITQIPFLKPAATTAGPSPSTTTSSSSSFSHPACTSNSTPLQHLHDGVATAASSVTLVPPVSSLQTIAHQQQQLALSPPQQPSSSSVGSAAAGSTAASVSSQQLYQQQGEELRTHQVGVSQSQTGVPPPPVSGPPLHSSHASQTNQVSMSGNAIQSQATGHQLPVSTDPSLVNTRSNLPSHTVHGLPVAVTSAFEVPSTVNECPSHPPHTATSSGLSELAPVPQITSAFAQVQQQPFDASNPHGKPDLHPPPPPPPQTRPEFSASLPPPPPPSISLPATTSLSSNPPSQSEAGVSSTASQQPAHQPPPTGGPPPPLSQPAIPQPSSESHQPTSEPEQQQQPQVTHHQEVRHNRHDDQHGYYHDPYYPDRDQEHYYGDPRDRHRAPSAFSEREADPYRHGYRPRPDSRVRYDYPHYPDHPADSGYRYGPSYGYDDPYRRGGGYPPPLYGPHAHPAARDEYGMPPHPYYDPYDPYGYHNHRPYDPRYGGHYPPTPLPPSRGHYGSEYPVDPSYDYRHPSAYDEHDPRIQPESGYDSYPHQSYPHEELNPAEASAIGGQADNFEMSQFVESPNTQLPRQPHPQQMQHNSTAYLDPHHHQQQQQQQVAYPDQSHDQYPGDYGYNYSEQGYGQVQSV